MSAVSQCQRKTKETAIELSMSAASQPGQLTGYTGIGFFDHMLTAFCHYSWLDLSLKLQGDWAVDQHHSLEDLGYVMGTCFKQVLEYRSATGLQRFAQRYVPMDESLARAVVDLGGRPYLHFQTPVLKERIGTFESDALREFLRAFADAGRITLHLEVCYGVNSHHMVEALFKALGLALKDAMLPLAISGDNSTKGNVAISVQEVL